MLEKWKWTLILNENLDILNRTGEGSDPPSKKESYWTKRDLICLIYQWVLKSTLSGNLRIAYQHSHAKEENQRELNLDEAITQYFRDHSLPFCLLAIYHLRTTKTKSFLIDYRTDYWLGTASILFGNSRRFSNWKQWKASDEVKAIFSSAVPNKDSVKEVVSSADSHKSGLIYRPRLHGVLCLIYFLWLWFRWSGNRLRLSKEKKFRAQYSIYASTPRIGYRSERKSDFAVKEKKSLFLPSQLQSKKAISLNTKASDSEEKRAVESA